MECLQLHEAMIPCSRLHDSDITICYLTYCLDCGKDIARDCEAA
jgi:hypothetical protein